MAENHHETRCVWAGNFLSLTLSSEASVEFRSAYAAGSSLPDHARKNITAAIEEGWYMCPADLAS